jgi:hypothetical protein
MGFAALFTNEVGVGLGRGHDGQHNSRMINLKVECSIPATAINEALSAMLRVNQPCSEASRLKPMARTQSF